MQFLVAQTLLEREQMALALKEEEEVLVADLASTEQQLLVETEMFVRSWVRNSPLSLVEAAAASWCGTKRALAKMGDTARPGRDTNTGPPRRWLTLRFHGPLFLAVTCSVCRLRSI